MVSKEIRTLEHTCEHAYGPAMDYEVFTNDSRFAASGLAFVQLDLDWGLRGRKLKGNGVV